MLFGERHNAAEGRQLCSGFRRSVAILQATNPGEFDAAAYYRRKDCLFALRKTKITAQTKTMDGWKNFFHSCAMNRRYCSGSCWGKRTERPHPPWCSDGKRNGQRSKSAIPGRRNQPSAGNFRTAPVPDRRRTVRTFEKVRLPVTLSAGISTWILIVYAQLTGMGISTRRALVMFLLFLAAGLLKRTPDLPTSLAVAALLLLVPKPQRILDAGFQLSFRQCSGLQG